MVFNIPHRKVSRQTRQEFISLISFLKHSGVRQVGGLGRVGWGRNENSSCVDTHIVQVLFYGIISVTLNVIKNC